MLLKTFLEYNSIHNDIGFSDISSGVHVRELESLSNSIRLVPLPSNEFVKPPASFNSLQDESHNCLIDEILEYLRRSGSNSQLIRGYVNGIDFNGVSNTILCEGVHSSIQLLKSTPFELIRSLIGIQCFVSMLINYSAYYGDENLRIWGPVKPIVYRQPKTAGILSVRRFMYSEKHMLHHLDPFPSNSKQLLNAIFKASNVKNTIPKRYRKIDKLLRITLVNHSNKQRTYPYIFDSICPKADKTQLHRLNNLELKTNKKNVIRFVIILIESIFPVEIFGSAKNKSTILSRIAFFLNSSKKEQISSSHLCNSIKLNDIYWIKPSNGKPMTKQEYVRGQTMFREFITWLFSSFISKIVGSFFHVTEASQSTTLLYYRHDIWSYISKKFKDRYYGKYLTLADDATNDVYKFGSNDHYIGRSRILPKPKDFRYIVAPFKGNNYEKFDYIHYLNSELKPVSAILNQLKPGVSVGSVSEIFPIIKKYKQTMLDNYDGKLPQLHALKFDVKQAYDTIPVEKVVEVVDEVLGQYSLDHEFVVNEYQPIDPENNLGRKRKILSHSKCLEMQKVKMIHPGSVLHTSKTIVLNKREIINIVKAQLSKTAVYSNEKTFLRKDGIFQGFPLSGVFCSIVYDKLVEYLYSLQEQEFKRGDLKILRLADDFLILSPRLSTINFYRKKINRNILDFNVSINRKKSLISSSLIDFVNVTIDLTDLSVYKKIESYDVNPIAAVSFSSLFNSLEYLIEKRIGNNSCSPAYNGEESLKVTLASVTRSIILKFINSNKTLKMKDKLDEAELTLFIEKLKSTIFRRVRSVSSINNEFLDEIIYKELSHRNIHTKSRDSV